MPINRKEEIIFRNKTSQRAKNIWFVLIHAEDFQDHSKTRHVHSKTRQLCFVAMLGLFETYTILKDSYTELGIFH